MTASGVADPTPGGPVAVRVIGVDPGRTPTRADALISAPDCHTLKIRASVTALSAAKTSGERFRVEGTSGR